MGSQALVVEESQHARFSPSASKKWITCPGSLTAEERYPNSSNAAADEGTAAHTVLEWAGVNRAKAKDFPHKHVTVNGVDYPVDAEMIGAVQWVLDVVRKYGGIQLFEARVSLERYGLVDCWGTSDVITLAPDQRRLYVDDLKYGRNVLVYAESNPQCVLYGAGALSVAETVGYEDAFDEVVVTIHQPRRKDPDTWVIPVDKLREWIAVAKEAQEQALSDDPPFVPGPHCQECFCKHKANCDAYVNHAFEGVDLYNVAKADGSIADPARIAKLHERVSILRDVAKAIEEEAFRLLNDGTPVPGLKLVNGRGSRAFTDEDKAVKILKGLKFKLDQYKPRKMITAPQTETLVGKKVFKEKFSGVVETKPGSLTVVPASDPRPAAKRSAEDAFAGITGEASPPEGGAISSSLLA